MSLNPKRSETAVNAETDAVCWLLNEGYLRIYDGNQPATADELIGFQTLLAELRFNAIAFQAAVKGLAAANPMTAEPSSRASGKASWFRALKADGFTRMFDGSVGREGCDLDLDTTAIVKGAEVGISSFIYKANAG